MPGRRKSTPHRKAAAPAKAARKKAIVAMARQMAVDLWRWRTGRVPALTFGWTMVGGPQPGTPTV